MTVASVAKSPKSVATEIASDIADVAGVAGVARVSKDPLERKACVRAFGARFVFSQRILEKSGDSGDTGDTLETVRLFCRQSDLTTGDTGDSVRRGAA